nr:MAG TPA: hypothetical protein [Caudoviricetes sp.]
MLVSGSDFYCGNSSGSPCQFALKNQIPSAYSHPSSKQCSGGDCSTVNGLRFVIQSTDPGVGSTASNNAVVLVYE